MINLSKNLVAQFSIGKFKCEDCDEYYFNNAVIFFDYDPETHEINEIQDEILFPTSYYSIDVAIAKHRELARTGMFETADFFSSIDLYDDETGDVVFYDLWTGVIENEYQKKTQEITQTSTACIKRHRQTGLKYFCTSGKVFIEGYKGSGSTWLKHCDENGFDIETLWVSQWYQPGEEYKLNRFAVLFSFMNKIVQSDDWANDMTEEGIPYSGSGRLKRPNSSASFEKMVLTRKKINNGIYNNQDGRKNPSWKGWYKTPWGIFETVRLAVESKPENFTISKGKIRNNCYNNLKGFGFIPKESQDDFKLD